MLNDINCLFQVTLPFTFTLCTLCNVMLRAYPLLHFRQRQVLNANWRLTLSSHRHFPIGQVQVILAQSSCPLAPSLGKVGSIPFWVFAPVWADGQKRHDTVHVCLHRDVENWNHWTGTRSMRRPPKQEPSSYCPSGLNHAQTGSNSDFGMYVRYVLVMMYANRNWLFCMAYLWNRTPLVATGHLGIAPCACSFCWHDLGLEGKEKKKSIV